MHFSHFSVVRIENFDRFSPKFCKFWILGARPRRVLTFPEEKIQKFIDRAEKWFFENRDFLVHFPIVKTKQAELGEIFTDSAQLLQISSGRSRDWVFQVSGRAAPILRSWSLGKLRAQSCKAWGGLALPTWLFRVRFGSDSLGGRGAFFCRSETCVFASDLML